MKIENIESKDLNHEHTADAFENVWRQNLYQGFSKNTTGAISTPFLEVFINKLKKIKKMTSAKVLELGAGSGDHSFRMSLEGFDVTAVESSETATQGMRQRLLDLPSGPKVINQNLFDFVNGAPSHLWDGIYANSVLHCFTPHERAELYSILAGLQGPQGILAISFKAKGDALEKMGKLIADTPAGALVEGNDRVRRLFVSKAEPIIEEIHAQGYSVVDQIYWTVPNYNIQGEEGKFMGLIARK